MSLQHILGAIDAELRPRLGREGRVADYIPALARVDPHRFGIAVVDRDGREWVVGDADALFSVQSISKVFTLTLAMQRCGEALWERVHREPSGDPFNSLVELESEAGVPRNPFINAGASRRGWARRVGGCRGGAAMPVSDAMRSSCANPSPTPR
jgi:glutaminase